MKCIKCGSEWLGKGIVSICPICTSKRYRDNIAEEIFNDLATIIEFHSNIDAICSIEYYEELRLKYAPNSNKPKYYGE